VHKLLILGFFGLVAQLVDGTLGMAYGVTTTTLLLTAGAAPAIASATVHLAEVGTDARLGNRALALWQRRLAHRRPDGRSRRDRGLRRSGRAQLPVGRGRRAVGRGDPLLPRRLHPRALLAAPPKPQAGSCEGAPARDLPLPSRSAGGSHRRHGRRGLGTDRNVVAAVIGPARAAQGGRLDRHLGVPRHDRSIRGVPGRAELRGDQRRAGSSPYSSEA
jgi:hypothetical protein